MEQQAHLPTFLEAGLRCKQTDGHRSWPEVLAGNFPQILPQQLRAPGTTTQVRLDSPQNTALKNDTEKATIPQEVRATLETWVPYSQ